MTTRNASVAAYQRRLARLPAAVRRAALAELVSQAEAVSNKQRVLAPRGTGALRRTIRAEVDIDALVVRVLAGGPRGQRRAGAPRGLRRRLRAFFGASETYDYARAIEFGTVKRPATPFFWPVIRGTRAARRRQMRAVIQQVLEREFARG